VETPAIRQDLENLLSTACEQITELKAALLVEKIRLGENDTDGIQDSTSLKLESVKKMESVNDALLKLLAEGGYSADMEGLRYCAETLGLKDKMTLLHKLMQDCMHQNRINGGVIEVNRNFNDKLLFILKGESSGSSLYGPAGKMRSGKEFQSLARA